MFFPRLANQIEYCHHKDAPKTLLLIHCLIEFTIAPGPLSKCSYKTKICKKKWQINVFPS